MGGVALDDGSSGVKAPDGGWGWAVLFGCFIITGFSYAFPKAVSVFFKELIREFDVGEKRPLANGLAAAGSPVALCCLSPLGQVLQYYYGWRGGFLILGGMLLNCCACGALMRPLVPPKKPETPATENTPDDGNKKAKPKSKLLDFSVFRDPGFVIYTVAASIMVLGLFVPPVFVVSYAKELGNEDTKSALLLSILGFIDIFARPTCGIIAGLQWVRPRCVYLFSFALIFNGTTDLVGSLSKDYTSLVVFCIFFGISYGMVGALQFEVLMAVVGTEKFSSAIGLVLLLEAIAVLVGPPSAGRLLDSTKNYMFVFLLAGTEVVLSALVLAICNLLFIKKKPEPPETATENGEPVEAKNHSSTPPIEEPHKSNGNSEKLKDSGDLRDENVTQGPKEVDIFLKDKDEQNKSIPSSPESNL
ncbi:monocarboxylate transporter 4-like protein [Labeo rohita]|uniref:Monocarboxylate transporter 4-like protein n=1 Tax=Labeo rohita TaxID=84645 RepID=A0A498NI20_LABRO|nr:monocarboxylate transporter 4-like protein [Labeo rohita]RXN33088.1 monocarboxylate transporter 4-like protein [Labeo rohita]